MTIDDIITKLRMIGVKDHHIEQLVKRRAFANGSAQFTEQERQLLEDRLAPVERSDGVVAIKRRNSVEPEVIGQKNFLELLSLGGDAYMVTSLSHRDGIMQIEKCKFLGADNKSGLATLKSWIL
ncbi:hypothetical protein [Pseudomonas sp. URMO17WK12:I2]|uniref:hypothetical protein n=1 Tax=Pseudomonas sp. URMO17WK12:I2 TaxID=1261623 RepID=UPI000DAE6944|nr:hypothetical protein [Pseudomonas sp. URMO17WK12:I2]PZW49719.1 hypothetical protein F469_00523 [Pseudomonas sp. URMO17WK12:I2]